MASTLEPERAAPRPRRAQAPALAATPRPPEPELSPHRGHAANAPLDFVSSTHKDTFSATFSHSPTINNDEPWIQHCATARHAWGANFVPKDSLGPGSDQPFMDLVYEPFNSYHWITRNKQDSATDDLPWLPKRKRNDMFDGSYATTPYASKHDYVNHLPARNYPCPLLQVDLKHGVRLMGKPIDGCWRAHNHFQWRNCPIHITDARWANGDIVFEPDGTTGEGICFNAAGTTVRWRVCRARRVSGPGGVKTFSVQRLTPAPIGSLKLWPFPPTNREDYSLPSPATPLYGPRRKLASWDVIIMPEPLDKLRRAIRREHNFAAACLQWALDHDITVISDEDFDTLRKIHRQAPTITLHNCDYYPQYRDTMWLRHDDGSIWEAFESDGPITPGRADPAGFRKDVNEDTPWANSAFFDMMEQGWPSPGVYPAEHSIIFRPYTRKLYQDIRKWVTDVTEGSDPAAFIQLFTKAHMDVIAIPWAAALRSSIPKPGRPGEFRMIVNLSAILRHWERAGAPAKISGIPHFSDSLNERICEVAAADEEKFNLEMSSGSDVGHAISIFHDWDIPVEIITFDAKSFFHCFTIYLRRAMAQGVIGPDGLGMSGTME